MEGGDAAGGIIGLLFMLIYIGILIAIIASAWIVFSKAGEPGFMAIIPIVNVFFLAKIAGKPMWWGLLTFIPLIGIIFGIIILLGLAEKFGKGAGFAVGLIFLPFIFFPILAFGDAQYQG